MSHWQKKGILLNAFSFSQFFCISNSLHIESSLPLSSTKMFLDRIQLLLNKNYFRGYFNYRTATSLMSLLFTPMSWVELLWVLKSPIFELHFLEQFFSSGSFLTFIVIETFSYPWCSLLCCRRASYIFRISSVLGPIIF